MTKLTTTQFDYSSVPAEAKGKLIWYAGEIGKQAETHANSGLEMGRLLKGAKELLPADESFRSWVERECGFTPRTAYNYITAFDHFGECEKLSHIELGAMYQLAKSDRAKKKALRLASKGERITYTRAKELVAEAEQKTIDAMPDQTGSKPDRNRIVETAEPESAGEDGREEPQRTDPIQEQPNPPAEENATDEREGPRPLTPAEQAIANRSICKQLLGKLYRALDDLNEVKPNPKRRDEAMGLVQKAEGLLW